MTKEELIHITDICFNIPVAVRRADDTRTYHKHECEEAKKIVLKILEQEPKTGYISIDDVMSVFDDFMCGDVDEDGMDLFLEMLRDKAEQYSQDQTGHWIFKNGKYRCDVCGEKAIYRYSGSSSITQTEILTKYCPNCGADMRGEE